MGEDESTIFARRGSEVVRRGDGEMIFFGCLDGAAGVRVGRRREGAKERAVGHPAAATAPAIAALIAHAHDTLSPLAFAQVNGHIRPHDAMRILPRYHASGGGQCASNALRASLGGQLPTDRRVVRWGRTKVPIWASYQAYAADLGAKLEIQFCERQQAAPNATRQPSSSYVPLLAVHCDHTTRPGPSMGHQTVTDQGPRSGMS